MSDIVERLRFDAVRCELHFSKGVADNIEEGIAEIKRLTADNHKLMLWNEQLQAELDITRRALEDSK